MKKLMKVYSRNHPPTIRVPLGVMETTAAPKTVAARTETVREIPGNETWCLDDKEEGSKKL